MVEYGYEEIHEVDGSIICLSQFIFTWAILAEVALVEAAQEMGIETDLHEEYSGRGMYGASTAGVVFSTHADFCACLAYASSEMTHEGKEDDLIEDMTKLSIDSMGSSIIFY